MVEHSAQILANEEKATTTICVTAVGRCKPLCLSTLQQELTPMLTP